jgi:hypothetical protein
MHNPFLSSIPDRQSQWLANRLTPEQEATWQRDGYIFLPGALGRDNAQHFESILDDVDAKRRRESGLGADARNNMHDAIGADSRFLELIDWPTTFPKVLDIMGWNIYLYHTQMVVSPPQAQSNPNGGSALGWHQDNNRMNRDMEVELQPMVSLKVLYFLNDIPRTDMGNFFVAPGTHLKRQLDKDSNGNVVNALPVTAEAGDALIFDRRLWHAASPNSSELTRKVLFYGYAYRWLRPKCAMDVSQVEGDANPIRRQLLGLAQSGQNGFFDVHPEDVPLRNWMLENYPEDQVPA